MIVSPLLDFEAFPGRGSVVFALPIAYLGQVMDALVVDYIAWMAISYTVTPFDSRERETLAVDAFKLAIQTVAINAPVRLMEYGYAVSQRIADLIHSCEGDE